MKKKYPKNKQKTENFMNNKIDKNDKIIDTSQIPYIQKCLR